MDKTTITVILKVLLIYYFATQNKTDKDIGICVKTVGNKEVVLDILVECKVKQKIRMLFLIMER